MAYPIFQSNTATKNTTKYPIFGGQQTQTKNPVFGQEGDNPKVEPLTTTKSWENMNFGEKLWATTKEIPNTLKGFIPQAVQEFPEKVKGKSLLEGEKELLKTSVVGTGQFAKQIAEVTAQAIGGAVLGAKQLITQKPETINLPILGEVSSYQVQAENLKKQGFSDEEAKALVGINAYLGIMPIFAKGLKTKAGQALVEKITTKEVPVVETPEGIKTYIKTGISPEGIAKIERPSITAVKKVFGQTEKQQEFNQLLQEHTEKFFEGRENLLSREEPLNKALVELADKELENYSKFTQGFQIPEIEVTPKLKTAVDLWKKVNAEEQAYLIEKGKLTPEQIENRRWKPVEMITGRTRDELGAMGVDPQYYPYLAEDLLKKSDFLGSTGRRTKGGYLKKFTGKMLQEDSYIKDPKIAIPRHRMQVFRDKMNTELVENIRDTFAEKDPIIIKELKQNSRLVEELGLEEWKPAGALRFYPIVEEGAKKAIGVTKKVESYWIPKDVASELNKFYKPGALEKALRLTYDPLIDMWRVSVLSLVPRWLYNNAIGNTMLSILGKTDPLAFLKSAKEMLARTKLGEKLGIGRKEIPEGVFMKQYAGGELTKVGKLGGLPKEQTQFLRPLNNWLNLLEQAKNYKTLRIPAIATQGLINGWVALGKPIGYLNKVVENWFRGAMYISKTEGKFLGFQLDKPVPPIEGVKYVNEFLFDYTKLSRTERATFRRALPFYNWMKNITEFTLKFPYNHPLRGLVVGALLQDYVDYINEVNQKADKTKSILRIKLDAEYEGKPLYLNVKSAIPFSDVFRTLPTNFETFGRFLTSNPVSKIIIERAFRLNSFTGQPFTQPSQFQQYDEFGKPIQPLPSISEHLGMQFPQVKLGQNILDKLRYGEVLKRYETGEPKMYRGKIQTEDWLMPILRYFGLSISAMELNKIKQQLDVKTRKLEVKQSQYERQIEAKLKNL